VTQAAASVKSAAGAVRSVAQSLLKAISPDLVDKVEQVSAAPDQDNAEVKSAKLSPQRDLQEIKVSIGTCLP